MKRLAKKTNFFILKFFSLSDFLSRRKSFNIRESTSKSMSKLFTSNASYSYFCRPFQTSFSTMGSSMNDVTHVLTPSFLVTVLCTKFISKSIPSTHSSHLWTTNIFQNHFICVALNCCQTVQFCNTAKLFGNAAKLFGNTVKLFGNAAIYCQNLLNCGLSHLSVAKSFSFCYLTKLWVHFVLQLKLNNLNFQKLKNWRISYVSLTFKRLFRSCKVATCHLQMDLMQEISFQSSYICTTTKVQLRMQLLLTSSTLHRQQVAARLLRFSVLLIWMDKTGIV